MRGYAIAAALMACICCASALECYVCNSMTDPDCDVTPLRQEYITNCSSGRNSGSIEFKPVQNALVCWKQRQDIEGLIIVDRSCGRAPPENRNNCYDRVGTKKIKVRYCVCEGRACNAAGLQTASVAPLLALALLAVGGFSHSARL